MSHHPRVGGKSVATANTPTVSTESGDNLDTSNLIPHPDSEDNQHRIEDPHADTVGDTSLSTEEKVPADKTDGKPKRTRIRSKRALSSTSLGDHDSDDEYSPTKRMKLSKKNVPEPDKMTKKARNKLLRETLKEKNKASTLFETNNGRHVGRKLIRWTPNTKDLLLLTMQYQLVHRGIAIPYDDIADQMFPEKRATGQAIIQSLNKLRKSMLKNGCWVPPLPGRAIEDRSNKPAPRGVIATMITGQKGENRFKLREILWNEDCSLYIEAHDIEKTFDTTSASHGKSQLRPCSIIQGAAQQGPEQDPDEINPNKKESVDPKNSSQDSAKKKAAIKRTLKVGWFSSGKNLAKVQAEPDGEININALSVRDQDKNANTGDYGHSNNDVMSMTSDHAGSVNSEDEAQYADCEEHHTGPVGAQSGANIYANYIYGTNSNGLNTFNLNSNGQGMTAHGLPLHNGNWVQNFGSMYQNPGPNFANGNFGYTSNQNEGTSTGIYSGSFDGNAGTDVGAYQALMALGNDPIDTEPYHNIDSEMVHSDWLNQDFNDL